MTKEKEFEDWAKMNNVDITTELHLQYQRSLIVSELAMAGVSINLPGDFLQSLNSQQFAEVIAGLIKRRMR
jgi:hypothetical protein